jgi:hypothetical protein
MGWSPLDPLLHARGIIKYQGVKTLCMAESATPKPGPNPSDSKEAVLQALHQSDLPAMTAGDVESEIDYSRKTATSRLQELADEEKIESGTIGGNTAYWAREPQPTADGHGGLWGHVPVEGITPTFSAVGIWFGVAGLALAVGHAIWGGLLTYAVISLGLTAVAAYPASLFQDKADPEFDLSDFKTRLEGDE